MKKLISFISVFLFMLFFPACTPSPYEDVRIEEFPDKYKKYDIYPWEMMEDQRFSSAYEEILDDFPADQYLHEFVSDLHVVATGNRFVSTSQGPFIFLVGCMAHACPEARVLVLYDPNRNSAWAYAYDLGVHGRFKVWLGQPNDRIKKLIDDLDIMIDRRI